MLTVVVAAWLFVSPMRAAGPASIEITWLSISNIHLEIGDLRVLIDGYITRIPPGDLYGGGGGAAYSRRPFTPDMDAITRVLNALGGPGSLDLLMTGHSHFDHSFDTATWSRLTEAPIIGSPTTCLQAQAQNIPADRCTAVYGGERLVLGDGITLYVVRWNHSGSRERNPEQHDPVELAAVPVRDPATGGLRPGVAEDFPNGGGNRGYLFVIDGPERRLSLFFQNSGSASDLDTEIVIDGRNYGAPIENLRRAMRAANLERVDLWIGAGGLPIAERVVPVIHPGAYIPVHWDGLAAPFFGGVTRPYNEPEQDQLLRAAGATVLAPAQYADRWLMDRSGVRAMPNDSMKRALGF
jgi:L-ascorbate metabolism protein UlaG (beta-lactamase superfamily)